MTRQEVETQKARLEAAAAAARISGDRAAAVSYQRHSEFLHHGALPAEADAPVGRAPVGFNTNSVVPKLAADCVNDAKPRRTTMNFADMTLPQLAAAFNEMVRSPTGPQFVDREVTKFRDKPTAIARCEALARFNPHLGAGPYSPPHV
jgi:hypothetical protein